VGARVLARVLFLLAVIFERLVRLLVQRGSEIYKRWPSAGSATDTSTIASGALPQPVVNERTRTWRFEARPLYLGP